eukprot:gene7701-biopygen13614
MGRRGSWDFHFPGKYGVYEVFALPQGGFGGTGHGESPPPSRDPQFQTAEAAAARRGRDPARAAGPAPARAQECSGFGGGWRRAMPFRAPAAAGPRSTQGEMATPASGQRLVRVRSFRFYHAPRVRSASGPRPLSLPPASAGLPDCWSGMQSFSAEPSRRLVRSGPFGPNPFHSSRSAPPCSVPFHAIPLCPVLGPVGPVQILLRFCVIPLRSILFRSVPLRCAPYIFVPFAVRCRTGADASRMRRSDSKKRTRP